MAKKFYKALHTIGVGNLVGEHSDIPAVDGAIRVGAVVELSDELLALIGPDSFEETEAPKDTSMSEETNTPETPVTPEAPASEGSEATPAAPSTEGSESGSESTPSTDGQPTA